MTGYYKFVDLTDLMKLVNYDSTIKTKEQEIALIDAVVKTEKEGNIISTETHEIKTSKRISL
mgnify:CR=1 FL=1